MAFDGGRKEEVGWMLLKRRKVVIGMMDERPTESIAIPQDCVFKALLGIGKHQARSQIHIWTRVCFFDHFVGSCAKILEGTSSGRNRLS